VAPRVVSVKAWHEGSDRDFRIKGRRSRRFYQFADQLLRSEFELSRVLRFDGQRPDTPLVAELKAKVAQAREGMQDAFAEVEA
jgi:hypothetical protein